MNQTMDQRNGLRLAHGNRTERRTLSRSPWATRWRLILIAAVLV